MSPVPDQYAVTLDVQDALVYDELRRAVIATDVDLIEDRPDDNFLIVGGDDQRFREYAARLTTMASASKAGGRDDLLQADRTAKTRLREAQREVEW